MALGPHSSGGGFVSNGKHGDTLDSIFEYSFVGPYGICGGF